MCRSFPSADSVWKGFLIPNFAPEVQEEHSHMSPRVTSVALGLIFILGCGSENPNDTIPRTGKAPDLKRIGDVVIIEPPRTTVPQDYPKQDPRQFGALPPQKTGRGAGEAGSPSAANNSLTDARRGFVTKASQGQSAGKPASEPPPNLFHLVRYTSPVGELAAYLSPDPGDGQKHPA